MACDAIYGDYLAARYAGSQHETKIADQYFDRTLEAEPANPIVLERAFMVSLNGGDMDRAVELARRLTKVVPDHRMSRLVLSLAAIKDGNYKEAQKEIGSARAGGLHRPCRLAHRSLGGGGRWQ